jgi:Tetratricopeptide repeat
VDGSPDAGGWVVLPHWLEAPLGKIRKKLESFVYRGTPEESLEAAEDILRRQIRIFGPDGGPAAVGRANVAKKLEDLGRLDEARLLRREVVAGYKRHLGDGHIYTLSAELALGINLKTSGMSDEARDLFTHVHEERTRVLGPDDEATLTASRWLTSMDYCD